MWKPIQKPTPGGSICKLRQSRLTRLAPVYGGRKTLKICCNVRKGKDASQVPTEREVAWYDSHRTLPTYRSVYDFKAWVHHRNPSRYFSKLFTLKGSQVLRNVVPPMLWVAAVAAAIGGYSAALTQGLFPTWAPSIVPNAFAQAFITHTTVAMSLLLVFRTTQSYNRWDEARKFWGATLNRCRDVARQCVTLFPDPVGKDYFCRWIVCFVRAMHRHFQNEGNLEKDLRGFVPDSQLDMLLQSQHRPMKALHVCGEIIQQMPMHPIHQMQMSLNIQHFHDQLGACERLLRTPIPISYTRHTSRFLFLWLTCLPFALWPTVGWFTIPCAALIAGSLLKIDEIGMQIEEPFSLLPLDVIAGRIQTDVMSTLGDERPVRDMVVQQCVSRPQPSLTYSSRPMSMWPGLEGHTMDTLTRGAPMQEGIPLP